MASIKRVASGYQVRWAEKVTTTEGEEWKSRSRTFPKKDAAEEFAAERTIGNKRGERYRPETEQVVCRLGDVTDYYLGLVKEGTPTWKFRRSMMRAFLRFMGGGLYAQGKEARDAAREKGRRVTVDNLTIGVLDRYKDALPWNARKAATSRRRVLEVVAMWDAASKRKTTLPGVPPPESIKVPEVHEVERGDVPTVADIDAMVHALEGGARDIDRYRHLHARIALLLRYTGARVGQTLSLRWADVHLDYTTPKGKPSPYVHYRAGETGAKKGKGRVIPLHPALVAEMSTWDRDGEYVIPAPTVTFKRGDTTRGAFRTAWIASGVSAEKWGQGEEWEAYRTAMSNWKQQRRRGTEGPEPEAPADRGATDRANGSPSHGIRAGVLSFHLGRGVDTVVASYLTGHKLPSVTSAYVPAANPAASPYWKHMVKAVGRIPAYVRAGDETSNVLPIRANG